MTVLASLTKTGAAPAAVLSAMLAFGSGALAQSNGDLRVGGSTTLVPSVVNAASTFMETYETWDAAGVAASSGCHSSPCTSSTTRPVSSQAVSPPFLRPFAAAGWATA